jgi:hypothetical protein
MSDSDHNEKNLKNFLQSKSTIFLTIIYLKDAEKNNLLVKVNNIHSNKKISIKPLYNCYL